MTQNDDRARVLANIAIALGQGDETAERAQRSASEERPEDDARAGADRAALARMFRDELGLVGGETRFVSDEVDLPAAIADYIAERGLGAASTDVRSADFAVLEAEALIADIGSCVVIERSANRGLAPYLPRTCIVTAPGSSLHRRLTSAALASVFAAARRGDRGEAVIITGPSRTADIEKTVVLGAHGPKSLIVFITGVAPEETKERS